MNVLDSVNDQFEVFKKLVLEVIDRIAPLKTRRLKKNHLPWVDNELQKDFQARDKLYSLACSYNDKNHEIWEAFREVRNI